jgi:hypothetical protein
VDLVASTNPDLVHDLDRIPWALPREHFEEVWTCDVLKHLDDLVAVMEGITALASQ